MLSAIDVPADAVMCRDANCELHIQDIDCFHERIVSCIKCADDKCISSKPTQSKFKAMSGWNNESARARFKYALRATKRAEEIARADALANNLCENDNIDVWKNVSKINQTSSVIASSIGGISGECNILMFRKDHFSSILNSSGSSNVNLKNSIMRTLHR